LVFGAGASVDGAPAGPGPVVVTGPVVVGFCSGAPVGATVVGAADVDGGALVVVVVSSCFGLPRPPCAAVAIPPAASNNTTIPATMITTRRLATVGPFRLHARTDADTFYTDSLGLL
jgi:hypothetical protein